MGQREYIIYGVLDMLRTPQGFKDALLEMLLVALGTDVGMSV